jgi:hypothetical protein
MYSDMGPAGSDASRPRPRLSQLPVRCRDVAASPGGAYRYPESFADPGPGFLMASNQLASLSAALVDWAVRVRVTDECLIGRGWVRE